MARTSGTHAWVKTGPAEQARGQLAPASAQDTYQPFQSHRVAQRCPDGCSLGPSPGLGWCGGRQGLAARSLPGSNRTAPATAGSRGSVGVLRALVIPGSTAHPRLTAELTNARRRCQTCSQPARLEPSSRKVSCSPRTPPSSARNRRGVLTWVRGRGVSPPPPRGCPAPPPPPVPEVGRARRTRRQGWQGCAGRHSRARLSDRAGGSSGGPGRDGRRQRGRLSVLSAAGGEQKGGGRAPGVPQAAGAPGTGSAWKGENPGESRGGVLGREVYSEGRCLGDSESWQTGSLGDSESSEAGIPGDRESSETGSPGDPESLEAGSPGAQEVSGIGSPQKRGARCPGNRESPPTPSSRTQ